MTNNATTPGTGKEAPAAAAAAAATGADERLESLLRHQARLLPDPTSEAAFREHILAAPAPCVRLNPLVPAARLLRPELERLGQPVPWCGDAFVLADAGHHLGHCLEFRLGALYIQAKATSLAVEALAPQPGELVLDLAAAPGGKATQIAGRMANSGLLIANEPRSRRVAALVGNLERCGVHNAVVTKAPGTVFARSFHNCFDRVLLDAPCSGDGIVGKDRNMLRYWSPADARAKAVQQIGLVRAAFHMLRPGGTLVYSTCSLSTEENEDVLLGLVKRFPGQVRVEPVQGLEPTPLPAAIASQYPEEFARVARVWPHLHRTEGGVVIRLSKEGETGWKRVEADLGELLGGMAAEALPGDAQRLPEAGSSAARPAEGAIRAALAERWQLCLDAPADQELAPEHKQVSLRPVASAALRDALPGFVRAGMRLATVHKGHLFLTQQTVQLWGDRVEARRLDLTWPQVQALFRGEPFALEAQTPLRGEVICRFGPWPVCRALVERDGRTVQGYLSKALRTNDLERLTGV